MNDLSDTQDYDAFGEKSPAPRPMLGTAVERRARKMAIAIFWSLALLIVVGRVHYAPALSGGAPTMELASR